MNSNRHKFSHLLVEFFEIAIYSLLKMKQIYPHAAFARKQKYGHIVYQPLHPQLKEYMFNYMKAVYHFAVKDQLDKIAICFYNDTYNVIEEKVIFEIANVKDSLLKNDAFLAKLDKTFSSFFMNLNLLYEQNENDILVENKLFTLQIYTKRANVVPFIKNSNFEDFPWVRAAPKHSKLSEAEIIPFDIAENTFINIQIYIEKLYT